MTGYPDPAPARPAWVGASYHQSAGCRRPSPSHGPCRPSVRRFRFPGCPGTAQVSICLSALRALERSGQIRLPARRTPGGTCVRQHRPAPVAPAHDVPADVGQVQGLALVVVSDPAHREIWQGLMEYEHPQGAGPLVGPQMRYLLWSEHGWLGAVGVAASALQLAPRDCWIGWDAATRLDQQHRVVGLSRFLIRPQVRCRNLTSHVLDHLLRRLAVPPTSPRAMAHRDLRVAAPSWRQPARGQLAVSGRDRGSWPAGPHPRHGGRAQDGLYP